MCGIIGLYKQDRAINFSNFTEALKEMQHRGPDGQDTKMFLDGKLMLGHTRLSIRDLSSAAEQPMFSNDGRYVIVFNGEIDNYLDLRSNLLLLVKISVNK